MKRLTRTACLILALSFQTLAGDGIMVMDRQPPPPPPVASVVLDLLVATLNAVLP